MHGHKDILQNVLRQAAVPHISVDEIEKRPGVPTHQFGEGPGLFHKYAAEDRIIGQVAQLFRSDRSSGVAQSRAPSPEGCARLVHMERVNNLTENL